MKILHMTLHKVWFNQIAEGLKKEEYREIKHYWTNRLTKEYDVIVFKNGYRNDAPEMMIEYLGYEIKEILHPISNKKEIVYALKLGKIIELKNHAVEKQIALF